MTAAEVAKAVAFWIAVGGILVLVALIVILTVLKSTGELLKSIGELLNSPGAEKFFFLLVLVFFVFVLFAIAQYKPPT